MVYTFLTFELDEGRFELRDAGTPVSVEPRVLEFLLHLVRHRDRVVTKDQLATEVWNARVVSDAALARCASDARRLLGDTERPYRIIETAYGRGYRFAAPVTEDSVPPVEEPPRSSAGRRALVWIVLLSGLLFAVGTTWMMGAAKKRNARVAPTTPPVIAVVWSVSEQDPKLRWVGLSFADLIGHALGENSGLVLVAPPFFQKDATAIALVARGRSLGARGLLHLAVTEASIAGTAKLEAQWFEDLSQSRPAPLPLLGDILPIPEDAPGALSRFLETRDSLIETLAARLRVTLDSPEVSTLKPRDAEAWRLYLSATVRWEVACSDSAKADLLERSLEIDPDFAPAWYLLAGARLARANLCGSDGPSYALAEEAARRALELAPTWPAPYQLVAAMELYRNATEEAHVQLLAARERFPNNVHIWMRSAEVLRYAGFLDQSLEAYKQGLSFWPAAMALTDSVPYPYLYLGDWDRFLESLSGRDSPYFRYYRGWAEWWNGNPDQAREALEPAFREHPGDLFGRLSQALFAILEDRHGEAVVVLEQLIRQRQGDVSSDSNVSSDGEVTYKIAQLLVMAGEIDSGLDQLDLAVRQGFFCPPCMTGDPAFAPLQADPRFRSSLERALRRHRGFAERFGLEAEDGVGISHSMGGNSTSSGKVERSPVLTNLSRASRKPSASTRASRNAPWVPPWTTTSLPFLKNGASSVAFSKGVEVSQLPWMRTVGMFVSKFSRKSSPRSLPQVGQVA